MVNKSPSSIRFLSHGKRVLFFTAALTAVLAPFGGRAQSVPVPFAGLFAGGATTFCAGSLPVVGTSTPARNFGDGCTATQSAINVPIGVATDSLGNVFIGDQTDMLVRVVYNGGTALAAALTAANVQNPGLVPVKGDIYTIAGGYTSTSGLTCAQKTGTTPVGSDSSLDGCPATESEQGPRGIAVDADGNLFIASVSPVSQIRIVYVGGTKAAALITLENPTITSPQVGYVYNIAGGNSSAYGGDGALATKANMNTVRGLWVDANENVYVADEFNNAVRFVSSATGFISTVAGHNAGSVSSCSGVAPAGDGSSATATTASLACPYGIALDQYGNIFIAEAGNGSATVPGRIRVVYEGGTLPGISSPTPGNIYTYAGGPPTATSVGTTPAQLTAFQEVFGVSIDPEGYLYVTDYRTGSTGSNHIWRIDPTNGNIAAIAGNGTTTLTAGAYCNGLAAGPTAADKYGDGCPATQAYLNTPQEGVAFAANGNFYVADRSNNLVRSFTYNNIFAATAVGSSVTQPLAFLYPATSVPSTETFTTQGSSTADYADVGSDTCALNTAPPTTTCVYNVKFAPLAAGQRPGSITVSSATATVGTQTLSGLGIAPVLTINPATAVAMGSSIQPLNISTDQLGNVNISDGKGKQVLRTTVAGGTPAAYITGLGQPRQTATDAYGNVYVADSVNNTVIERTTAGTTVSLGSGLSAPQGVVADILGNIYVADTGNNRLLYISPITGDQHIVTLSGFTLSAPTYLALDPSGDLYVIDTGNTRVIEIPLGALPQLVTLPSSVQPAAIAFDPGGDTYFADTVSESILLEAPGSTTTTSLFGAFHTLDGVAVGPTGNVFVADSAASSANGYNFAVNASTFATTNIGLTSLPVTVTIGSVGNLSATLATPPYTESGSSAYKAGSTATCTPGLVLATASTCQQSFVFSPTTPTTPQTAKVVFADTTGQSVNANFTAAVTNLIMTTTTITNNGSGTPNYGQTESFTVTMTPNSAGSPAPTGTISLIVDGTTVSQQTVSSNPYIFTVSLNVGTHAIAASYSGDANYAASNASTSITVGKAVTTTTDTYSQSASGFTFTAVVKPANVGAVGMTGNVNFYVDGSVVSSVPVGNGTVTTTVLVSDGTHTYYATYVGDGNYATSTSPTQSFAVSRTPTTITLTITPVSPSGAAGLQLTAKLSTTGTGTPTGTITFTNGSTTLGTVNLSTAVNGVVSITTTTTTYSSYIFTASYSGDGLFEPSTVSTTEGPDFVVTPGAPLSVPNGGQAVESITVAPINGYSGSLTAVCSNLPVNAICRFQPIPLTVAAPLSSTLSVQVFAGVNPSVAGNTLPEMTPLSRTLLAILLFTPAVFGFGRRRKACALPRLLPLALLTILTASIIGCGINKTPANSTATFTTPAGTTSVTVTVTDTNNVSRSAVFSLVVTQ